jgi:SPP1 family predicted phage head-tail adaptor
MQSGKLNRRIELQSPSSGQDSFGQPLDTWTTILNTWASIRAATSKEVYASSAFVSQVSHIITVRYQYALNIRSADRVIYDGRIFEIQAVSDADESKVKLNLLCLELNEGQ